MLNKYIKQIKDKTIRCKVLDAVEDLPEYFWKVPASSTGKYHPKFSLGEGGLVRHTSFAVELAIELFNITKFTDFEKDIIIAALILHDGRKHGLEESEHTKKDHADIQADYLVKFWEEYFEGRNEIIACIRCHMGIWGNIKPETVLERFVHHCDYIASRKMIDNYYMDVL
jgi:23S rRNA maturation-related 3'-5' exoribonuclease YhaM